MGTAAHLEAQGIVTPALTYLRETGPQLETDKWGQPLPLSAADQDRLDRIFAVLADPMTRGRALIVSGLLAPDEVDALITVHPDVWTALSAQAFEEMGTTPPPYRAWAEATLNVLFLQDAAQVFTSGAPPALPKQAGNVSVGPDSLGTPADRRETSVREQKGA